MIRWKKIIERKNGKETEVKEGDEGEKKREGRAVKRERESERV